MADVFYDESMSEFTPLYKGVFPAHVKGISTRTVNLKNGGGTAEIYTLEYKLATETEKVKAKDDKGNEVDCAHMVGKLFKDKGTFLFKDSTSFGKNRRYKELTDTLGISLEKVDKDGKTLFKLPDLMDYVDDIKGQAVLVTLDDEKWTNKDGEERKSVKVFSIQGWKDGKALSSQEMDTSDEDMPF
jgi:hypothetical protein